MTWATYDGVMVSPSPAPSPTSGPAVRPEAAPLSHDGGRVGFLLSHGFTGSPASMVPWGQHLVAQGHTVRVPRLPGHGTTWQDMNRTRWQDWYRTLEVELASLRERCDHVVVGDVEGYVHLLNRETGAFAARDRAGSEAIAADPVPLGRGFVVQDMDGDITAYEVR